MSSQTTPEGQLSSSANNLPPQVTWAQRSSSSTADKNIIFLTIVAPDVSPSELKVDLKPSSITFTGHSETKKTTYHVELEFYAEIDPAESKTHHSPRDVAFVLRKKEMKDEYWPRLTKASQKLHFLKTDFDKWVDEDEQDAVNDDDAMANLGGMGGMGGMGGGDGGFGGIDFSKLGGGAGGMPDMGDLGGAGGDEDDEDMPDLEDEDTKEEADEEVGGSSKPKIEEV
ncbi:MAG: hypothetical protein LQ340_000355 [Diploschistes diacapsis]|nr:MAG: hypothetical protein LQ340_000355 [Diploschistes diacapsis]